MRDVGGIGAGVLVEVPDHGTQVRQRLTPNAVWIVRHQRDEGRGLFQGARRGQLEEPGGNLGFTRRGRDAGDAGQVGDQPQLRRIRRQPRAQQAAAAAKHLATEGRQCLGDSFDFRCGRGADPAERPIPTVGTGRLLRQLAYCIRRREPLVSVRIAGICARRVVRRRHARRLHLAVERRERVAWQRLRRNRWRLGAGLEAGRGLDRRRCRLRCALSCDVRQRRLVGFAFRCRGVGLGGRRREGKRLRRLGRLFAFAVPCQPRDGRQGEGQGS